MRRMRNQTKKVERSDPPRSDDERNPLSWHQSFECSLFGTMKPEDRGGDGSPEPETEVGGRRKREKEQEDEEDESHEERCHKMALITPLRLMMLKRERQKERRKNGPGKKEIKDENGNTAADRRRGEYRDQNRKMDGVELSERDDDDDTEIGIWLSPGTDFSDRDDRKFGRYLKAVKNISALSFRQYYIFPNSAKISNTVLFACKTGKEGHVLF